ncbi:carboxypeptidase N subunit 2 isoform X2 [Megalobrama amblycephala]|uniref:carboxypeptidase N subunit 2 isoform X2 n=1 Tax=Megalobrama amblycephala TaxID=75352 RepID=UPI002013CACF|nr:carboxypeptidase N subunit 2 isoform X2 [Megalobrama amblycephala]
MVMSKHWAALLLVLIQLHCSDCCPELCQCFSAAKVVCADDDMRTLPVNISEQVRELIVVASGVTHLDSHSFRENLTLTKLVVLNGVLKTVSHDAFDRLLELQELDISGNSNWLMFDVRTFSSLTNLTRLLLNNNKISILDGGIFDSLQKLEMLQLRANILLSVPDRLFHRLHKLQELDLSFNQISLVSADVFQNNSLLRVLSLQTNMIPQLPAGIFAHLDHLEELNLRSNHISDLSTDVFPSSLRKLILKKNALAQLHPSVFHKLHHLTYLDLSQNKLSEVPSDLFQNLISLKKLDLSENQITTLPGTVFKGLFSIKAIHLQKNKLNSLEVGLLKDLHDMEQLYLSMNSLQSIPDGFFDELDFQCIVQLHGNPWRCDCGIQYLSDWLRNNLRNVEDVTRVYCQAPRFIRGHGVVSVEKERLDCAKNSSSAFQSSSDTNITEIPVHGNDGGGVRCSLRDANDVATIQCKLTKCTSVRFQALFEFVDGSESETVVSEEWLAPAGCSNGTT